MSQNYKKFVSIMIIVVILCCAVIAGLFYYGKFGPHMILTKVTFNHLPNWENDDHSQALQAFQQSCVVILKLDPALPFSRVPQTGDVSDWHAICLAAKLLDKPDKLAARQFFESWFEPYSVSDNFNPDGFFTGYYLPLIYGSLTPDKRYPVPIYGFPDNLIKVHLGLFQPKLAGITIKGQLKDNTLYPYPDRAAINKGAIKKHAKVVAWTSSSIDVFYAQVQGSAVMELPDHKQIVLAYDGGNGRPYTTIARVLVANKALTKEAATMQGIRAWFAQHPDQVDAILNSNASYTFFKILNNNNPLGAESVPLTAERSLAVDQRYIPLGAPLWLDTMVLEDTSAKKPRPFQHLMIAQDTGGAIKGIIRGDIYWGKGERAATIAGLLKSPGRYWILLPRHIHQ